MQLVTNHSSAKDTHLSLMRGCIASSKEIILCSGWMDEGGIAEVLPNLNAAIKARAVVKIYSNKKNTTAKAVQKLKENGIRHVMVSGTYLHAKIYYFEEESTFTVIIGSANLTKGGLCSNEELSTLHRGQVGDAMYSKVKSYIDDLNTL